MVETLSKIYSGNAASDSRCTSAMSAKCLPFWLKTEWWLGLIPPTCSTSFLATFFVLRDESGFEREVFADAAAVQ
jgi:hypothetical protein